MEWMDFACILTICNTKMEPNELKLCPDVNARDENKRQMKPTAKALANKIEGLQTKRQAKVHKVKGAIKVIKDLMQREDNAVNVQSQLEILSALFKDAIRLHQSVISLLPEEEQEKQNVWFASVQKYNVGFIDDVKKWLSDANGQISQSAAQMVTDGVLNLTQMNPPYVEQCDAQNDENESCVSNQSEPGVGNAVTLDDVKPSDSVSNVASHRTKKRSSVGSKSSASTASSARIKAEADMAALIVRQRLLKEKHVLEEQEEQLRKRKEHLDLETEIAASMAKVNVLRASEGSRASSVVCGKADGMNSYLEREQRKVRTLNADAETFVPVSLEQPLQDFSADHKLHPHLLGIRPKVRSVELQSQATLLHPLKPKTQHCGLQGTQTYPQFQFEPNHPAPLMQSGADHHLI